MDEGTRSLLIRLADRMDTLASRRDNHQEISCAHGLSILNDIERDAEHIARALRSYCANAMNIRPREG